MFDDKAIWYAGLSLMLGVFIGVFYTTVAYNLEVKELKTEAINRGFAEFVITDAKKGTVEWQWNGIGNVSR